MNSSAGGVREAGSVPELRRSPGEGGKELDIAECMSARARAHTHTHTAICQLAPHSIVSFSFENYEFQKLFCSLQSDVLKLILKIPYQTLITVSNNS